MSVAHRRFISKKPPVLGGDKARRKDMGKFFLFVLCLPFVWGVGATCGWYAHEKSEPVLEKYEQVKALISVIK